MVEDMKLEMQKFPKIGQLKDVQYTVRSRASYAGKDDEGNPIYKDPGRLPTLEFVGTPKLHGTNAAIRFDKDENGELQVGYQSRNRIITREADNAGFVAWCEEYLDLEQLRRMFNAIQEECVIYGEFCGGNIQKGVGICELEKMFVVFPRGPNQMILIAVTESGLVTALMTHYEQTIDFNSIGEAQNEIVRLTQEVEDECPVAKHFGIEKGTGEGIVWRCTTPGYEDLMFKSKGQKHSKSNVKQLSQVDLDKLNAIQALAQQLMTPERCQQGLEYLTEMELDHSRRNTGPYLKYVVSDCIAEEALAIEEAGFEKKQLGSQLSQVAKDWFFERV